MRGPALVLLLLAAAPWGVQGNEEALRELYKMLCESSVMLLLIFIGIYYFWKWHLPFPSESTIAMLLGIVAGGLARTLPGETVWSLTPPPPYP